MQAGDQKQNILLEKPYNCQINVKYVWHPVIAHDVTSSGLHGSPQKYGISGKDTDF